MQRHTSALLSTGAISLLIAGTSSGCGLDRFADDRILIWHDWPEPESAVLVETLEGYAAVDPDLDVIVEYVPDGQLEERFATETQSGFGPDIVIGLDASRLPDLVADRAVRSIPSDRIERHAFDELDSKAMEMMAIDGTQYGIPLAAFTEVLYYRNGVDPPDTLDDIIDLADNGHPSAIPTDFLRSYWGIDAFDGSVFDEADSNNDELDPDAGFVRWMQWLVDARPHPNIVLDGQYEVVRDLFAEGRIDLFVGSSRELGTFRSQMRAADLGPTDAGDDPEPVDPEAINAATPTLTDIDDIEFSLTVLPGWENQQPGGFLDVDGMVVNRHTSVFDEGLALIEYLSNGPSQGRIARSGVGRIPINESVSIDPSISPIEAALLAQQHRAVVLPVAFAHDQQRLADAADEVVAQVIRGVLEPEEAVRALKRNFDVLGEQRDG